MELVPFSEDTILEEREALMVSPTGGIPCLKLAHFLKPTVPSLQDSNQLKLPLLSPKSKWPLDVAFNGWPEPLKKWDKWVEQMHSKHFFLWKKAGILEAIMVSKYNFHRVDDLFFGIAERWNTDTNTFVFPWGEATVTLEDMMILGGFSVLGGPFLLPLEVKNLVDIDHNLKKLLADFKRMRRHNHLQWLNFFMESGKEYEHEAFLSLWLSRFVFPGDGRDVIGEHVIPIAVHLARGTRIALAPAVLASIYRDLSLLKESMAASTRLETQEGVGSILALSLWAPLHLVQLWAWERLQPFRPQPNFLNFGELRVARWHDVKRFDIGNVRPIIDSSGDNFLWRPYCLTVDCWSFPKFYKEKEELACIGQYPDEELESFARCLRVCVLVGIDCKEPYHPHRVAMQFGFDQDLPRWVPHSNSDVEIAWINYSRPLSINETLYLPSRLSESDVSTQYLEWWRKEVLVPVAKIQGLERGKRSSRTRKYLLHSKQSKAIDNAFDVPPGFQPRFDTVKDYSKTSVAELKNSIKQQIKVESHLVDVTPGFPPKPESSRQQISVKHRIKEEVNGLDVPPGFPPQPESERQQISVKHRIKEEVNVLDVPPGFPAQPDSTRQQISVKHRIQEEFNSLDVPPGFPPQPKSARKQSCVKQLDISPGFPPQPESSMKQSFVKYRIKNEVNDLDVPPGFPPKFDGMKGNIQTPVQKFKNSNHRQSNEDALSYREKPFSTSQFLGESSSTAAIRSSGRVQAAMHPIGTSVKAGTAGESSRMFAGHAYENRGNIFINQTEGRNDISSVIDSSLNDLDARIRILESVLGRQKKIKIKAEVN